MKKKLLFFDIRNLFLSMFLLIILLFLSGNLIAQDSLFVDFNTTTDLTDLFNPDSDPLFTNSSDGGIENTGAINVDLGTNDIWTAKTGYSVAGVGDIYVISAYFKIKANAGYGGLGLAVNDSNEPDSYGSPQYGLGMCFHGGGGYFVNNRSNTSVSWPPDLVLGNWYKMIYTLEATGMNTYDATFEIWNSDADGNLGTLKTTKQQTNITNTDIGGASTLHVYFSSAGSRMEKIDNFKIVLDGNASFVEPGFPVVITSDVSGIGENSASCGGEVTDENGSAVTARGVCWSTSSSPTISDSYTTDGSGTGTFSSSLTGLSPLTTYYVRAYATNTEGTSYGTEKSFTTTYSGITWDGSSSSDWGTAANWSSGTVPTATDDILIPDVATDPIVDETAASPAVCANLTVSAGSVLIVNSNRALTVNGDINNAGTIYLNSPANDGVSGSLIVSGTVTNTGTMSIERWIDQGSEDANNYTWHSMGLPVGNSSAGTYFLGDYVFAYSETDNSWTNIINVGNTLESGEGYIVKSITGNKTYTFTGTFNSGDLTVNLANSGPDASHGYNLVSNPYPSPIDLESLNTTNISNTFYVWDSSTEQYLSYQLGGSGSLSRYLLPCQAFFAKVADGNATGSITFENAARTHTTTSATFKSASTTTQSIVLNVTNSEGLKDQLYVNVSDIANEGYKLFSMNSAVPQLSAKVGGKDFAIYNINEIDGQYVLPLGFQSTLSGEYSFGLSEQAFGDVDIVIKDKLLDTETNLVNDETYTFSHEAENSTDRFELIFNPQSSTGIAEETKTRDLRLYSASQNVILSLSNEYPGHVEIYNLAGKLVAKKDFNSSYITIPLYVDGLYIVKVVIGNEVITKKINVNK